VHPLSEEIRDWLQSHADAAGGAPTGYTGSPRPQYGVRVPDLRAFLREWEHRAALDMSTWINVLDDLYQGDYYEERTAAGMIFARFKKYRQQLDFATLDRWLGQLEGWAEVDTTCQSTYTARELLSNWDAWADFLTQLSTDDNINKRRASLILLVKPLRESPDRRLLELGLAQVERLKHERDKLITKAVSWVLREGTKQHTPAIRAYVGDNAASLASHVVREVRRKLDTGKR